jgi:hypothetical protein
VQFISFTRVVIIIELLINQPHTPGFEGKTHTGHGQIHSFTTQAPSLPWENLGIPDDLKLRKTQRMCETISLCVSGDMEISK